MKRFCAVVFASVIAAGAVHAAELVKSPEDAMTFNTCKAMKSAERNASTACKAIMQKTKVTSSDMDKMKECEAPTADVNKNPDCKAVMEKHPEIARGHGRLETDSINDAPKPGNNGAPAPGPHN